MKERYLKFFTESVKLSAKMSYCERKKVGAIIVNDNRIIVNSWNGTVSGEDNCCEEDFGDLSEPHTTSLAIDPDKSNEDIVKDFCSRLNIVCVEFEQIMNVIKLTYKRPSYRTKLSVVHAEANAISFAAKEGIRLKDTTMFVTLSPCINCANLIIQSGIKEVYYIEDYRDNSGVKHLTDHGIIVNKIDI